MKSSLFFSLIFGSLVASRGTSNTARNSQYAANTLGTDQTPRLGHFRTDNPLPQGYPWGMKTANNTNCYDDPPHTGVIRSYDFTITRGKTAPDGYEKDALLINNQFPGPLIEANWGDTIQVTVHNQIDGPPEGTALHWHGLLQKESQWFDGVPGIQQCPIPPNGTFTYTFLADLYGTTWYHGHYSSQYAAGLLGPLVIHGPTNVPYDIDVGPILLSDWYHEDYLTILRGIVGTELSGVTRESDNNLINARNNYDCSQLGNDTTPCFSDAGLANFKFTPGKVHRLRLVNAGAEGMQKFSIDGHTLKVIAQDFVPIIPYETEVVTLGIGQRSDVLVTGLSSPNGSYFMRSSIPTADGCSLASNPDATAIVYYNDLARTQTPNTTPWPAFLESLEFQCGNDPLEQTVPWFPITPDPNPPLVEEIVINFGQNETGNYGWSMNDSRFRTNYNQPVLLLSKLGNNSYPDSPEWNIYNTGSSSSVRIVVNNNFTVNHPMHLHGHNMYILSVGNGTWDGQTIVNPQNPTRRDVQIIPGNGHMVIQFDADNPGVWPFHCHIAWHVSSGLSISVLERPDDIANLPIPAIMAQTCRDWADFTNRAVVDQIDSGL